MAKTEPSHLLLLEKPQACHCWVKRLGEWTNYKLRCISDSENCIANGYNFVGPWGRESIECSVRPETIFGLKPICELCDGVTTDCQARANPLTWQLTARVDYDSSNGSDCSLRVWGRFKERCRG